MTSPSLEIQEYERQLAEPSDDLVRLFRDLEGDVLIVGVGGKMGPTVASMARRAMDDAEHSGIVFGASRFSNSQLRGSLESIGVETLQGDLLDLGFLERLPQAKNVIFLAGTKFGTVGNEPLTWATNVLLAGQVARRFADSRIVALSTGNVYGPVDTRHGRPSREDDPPRPIGEYAMSCVGRERMFEYASGAFGSPVTIVRLNYATELRYGVLVDIASRVAAEQPVSLEAGWVNVIWQRDACDWILRCLTIATSPPTCLNMTGPELLSVRDIAEQLGRRLDRAPQFSCEEGPTALLSDASRAIDLFGRPKMSVERMLECIADWVTAGKPILSKPTHFEAMNGNY